MNVAWKKPFRIILSCGLFYGLALLFNNCQGYYPTGGIKSSDVIKLTDEEMAVVHQYDIGKAQAAEAVKSRYIIQLSQPAILEAANISNYAGIVNSNSTASQKAKVSMQTVAAKIKTEKDVVIDAFNGAASKSGQKVSAISGKVVSNQVISETSHVLNTISVETTEDVIEELRKLPQVKAIYAERVITANLNASVRYIKADQAWAIDSSGNSCGGGANCLTGRGVKVAIIDTGVDYTHAVLGGCLGSGCKVIGGYDFINNDTDPMDDHGHGTHVAGTAAGRDPAGTYNGVAPDAQILAYKVLDATGNGGEIAIIAGIDRAVTDGAQVLNMSLGGEGGTPFDILAQAVDRAYAAGTLVVVAGGNSGADGFETIGTPGTARNALTVGAIDDATGLVASFSSRGPVELSAGQYMQKPEVMAPGVQICAAKSSRGNMGSSCGTNMVAASGTSMATPHVSGVGALIVQSLNLTTATANKARDVILGNVVQPSVPNKVFEYGRGIVDARRAVTDRLGLTGYSGLQVTGRVTTTQIVTIPFINHSAQTVSFTYSAPNVPSGITNLNVNPTTVSLSPGASQSVTATYTADASQLPYHQQTSIYLKFDATNIPSSLPRLYPINIYVQDENTGPTPTPTNGAPSPTATPTPTPTMGPGPTATPTPPMPQPTSTPIPTPGGSTPMAPTSLQIFFDREG